ncbi:MAG: hypothetical protein DWI09_02820 [Planctomycetota bacterium]|nr:MAG: hypothetical protein DWI09_02820 [Planctomycetota bacterium]
MLSSIRFDDCAFARFFAVMLVSCLSPIAICAKATAQNACTAAGIDANCCAQVCAINPLCCSTAWDANCGATLVSIGCICNGAIPINSHTVAIDTTTATRDLNLAGLCDPGPFGDDTLHNYTVFSWTPPDSGRYTLSTCGLANFDTRIALLAGCASPTVLGCNDDGDGCSAFTSILSVDVIGGHQHYIIVGGYSEADIGVGTLSIESLQVQLALEGAHKWEVAAGGNGHWYVKYAVGSGANWSDIAAKAQNLGATLACANTASENRLIGSLSVATGAGTTVALGLYQDLASARYLEPAGGWKWTDGTAVSFNSWSAGEPNNGGASANEHFGQISANSTGAFWSDNADNAAWTHAIFEFGPKGLPQPATPPSNDESSAPIALEIGQFNVVSLVGATSSADALGCGAPLFYDRWYSFTPPNNASYDIAACGNGFDASVVVYNQATRSVVGCSAGQCTTSVSVVAGTSYLIRIGSPDGTRIGLPTLFVYQTPVVASRDAISVNFVGGASDNGSDGDFCVDTAIFPAGADGLGTLHWTNIVGPNSTAAAAYATAGKGDAPTALLDGHGLATTTAINFAVNNPWRIVSYPTDDTGRMRRGYLDSNGLTSITVSASAIPYQRYSAVVYFVGETADRLGSVSVNASAPIYFKTDSIPGGVFNPLVRATATSAPTATRASFAVFTGLTGSTCAMRLFENGPNLGFQGFQIVQETTPCLADLNADARVNAQDLATLLGGWGTTAGDLNGDATTNALDLAFMLSSWGACP